MRLKMILQLEKPELDIQYRRAFLSLLKASFQEASQVKKVPGQIFFMDNSLDITYQRQEFIPHR